MLQSKKKRITDSEIMYIISPSLNDFFADSDIMLIISLPMKAHQRQ